jgi:hypothetical protein
MAEPTLADILLDRRNSVFDEPTGGLAALSRIPRDRLLAELDRGLPSEEIRRERSGLATLLSSQAERQPPEHVAPTLSAYYPGPSDRVRNALLRLRFNPHSADFLAGLVPWTGADAAYHGGRDIAEGAGSGNRLQALLGGGTIGLAALPLGIAPRNLNRIPNPIRVYHGSPHRFDQPRMDRIGTGEGGQAFGYGLYFAELEPVAREYRIGQFSLSDPHIQATAYLDAAGGNRQTALARLAADMDRLSRHPEYIQSLERAADLLRTERFRPTGHMYEANLHARPEQFLDWDRRLADQSEAIRDALRRSGHDVLPHETGESAYHAIANRLLGGNQEQASAALGRFGIPGIRYLDAGSRGVREGTHNYVVWSPEIIEMLRRYGFVGPVGGASLGSYLSNRQGNEQ